MDRPSYELELKRLKAKPPKEDLPKQKFKRGEKVHVCKEMPRYMLHFDSDFDAIVEYTYAQKYHGDDIDNYSLIVLDNEGVPINSISWYNECQLTLLDSDTQKGKSIIDSYRFPE